MYMHVQHLKENSQHSKAEKLKDRAGQIDLVKQAAQLAWAYSPDVSWPSMTGFPKILSCRCDLTSSGADCSWQFCSLHFLLLPCLLRHQGTRKFDFLATFLSLSFVGYFLEFGLWEVLVTSDTLAHWQWWYICADCSTHKSLNCMNHWLPRHVRSWLGTVAGVRKTEWISIWSNGCDRFRALILDTCSCNLQRYSLAIPTTSIQTIRTVWEECINTVAADKAPSSWAAFGMEHLLLRVYSCWRKPDAFIKSWTLDIPRHSDPLTYEFNCAFCVSRCDLGRSTGC